MAKVSHGFDVPTARANGLETGRIFVLKEEDAVTMVLRKDDLFDLFVGEDFVLTATPSQVTNVAKRIVDPSRTGNLNTYRNWKTQDNGTDIRDFMPKDGVWWNKGQNASVRTGEVCPSCFVTKPLVGGCPTCD